MLIRIHGALAVALLSLCASAQAVPYIVTVDVSAQAANVGEPLSATINVRNAGSAAFNTRVQSELPPALSLNSVVGGSGWSCVKSGQLFDCWLPVLLTGQLAPPIHVSLTASHGDSPTSITVLASEQGISSPSVGQSELVHIYTPNAIFSNGYELIVRSLMEIF